MTVVLCYVNSTIEASQCPAKMRLEKQGLFRVIPKIHLFSAECRHRIIEQNLEPYIHLLMEFDVELNIMIQVKKHQPMSNEELEDLIELQTTLREAREKALIDIAREEALREAEAREKALVDIAREEALREAEVREKALVEKSRKALLGGVHVLAHQLFPKMRKTTLEQMNELTLEQLQYLMGQIPELESSKDFRHLLKSLKEK